MNREYSRAPSALAFMARAILAPRRPGLRGGLPALEATWRNHRVDDEPLDAFLDLAGLEGHPLWPLLYPQAAGFRLPMSLLTDFLFPFPIWGALQVRNAIVQREPYARGELLDLSARVADARALERGTEIDIACIARRGGTPVWESTTSFYYRGRSGAAQPASRLTATPEADGPVVAQWTPSPGSRARFGRLTGDYNGIHLFDGYARLFGFRGAFHHPQRVLGQCLARLPGMQGSLPIRLDAWLKGPVYYGAQVALRASGDRSEFALFVEGDERPAILGRLSAGS